MGNNKSRPSRDKYAGVRASKVDGALAALDQQNIEDEAAGPPTDAEEEEEDAVVGRRLSTTDRIQAADAAYLAQKFGVKQQQQEEATPEEQAEKLYQEAVDLRQFGDVNGAMAMLSQVLRMDGSHEGAGVTLGRMLWLQGQLDEAEHVYIDTLERRPTANVLKAYAKFVASARKDPALAERMLDRAVDLDPRCAENYVLLAQAQQWAEGHQKHYDEEAQGDPSGATQQRLKQMEEHRRFAAAVGMERDGKGSYTYAEGAGGYRAPKQVEAQAEEVLSPAKRGYTRAQRMVKSATVRGSAVARRLSALAWLSPGGTLLSDEAMDNVGLGLPGAEAVMPAMAVGGRFEKLRGDVAQGGWKGHNPRAWEGRTWPESWYCSDSVSAETVKMRGRRVHAQDAKEANAIMGDIAAKGRARARTGSVTGHLLPNDQQEAFRLTDNYIERTKEVDKFIKRRQKKEKDKANVFVSKGGDFTSVVLNMSERVGGAGGSDGSASVSSFGSSVSRTKSRVVRVRTRRG